MDTMNCLLLLFFGCISYSNAELQRSTLEKTRHLRYKAYKREQPSDFIDIRDVDCSGNRTTVFIVLGFFQISLKQPLKIKDYVFKYNPNVGCVIVVSWLEYATYSNKIGFQNKSSNYYIIAKKHVWYLAQDIYEKMHYVDKKGWKNIELVGHGMGAHAAGMAARFFHRNTKYVIDKIIGLDPDASQFLMENPQLALNRTDAKNVTVFHTNTNRYGISNETGSIDIFVNGGQKQPECKRKLTDNICSHDVAWDAFSEHLRETSGRLRSDRFVLCLDVSVSMDWHNRIMRAIGSAKKLLKLMAVGSYIGIVTFSDVAEMSHRIIQINDEADRESLISSLPEQTIGRTSIGAGLKLSRLMLQNLTDSDRFYSTIILLSDGEQNENPTPEQELPELQKAGIGVNSVAIGAEASKELEVISSDGNVIYAMENDDAQDITDMERALSFSYENEIDADLRPIYLPTQRVTLGNGENVIPIVIDESIGKDTEITLTGDSGINNDNVKLISPTGRQYSSDSSDTNVIASSVQLSYKIPLAEAGKWNLMVEPASKSRRSIRSTSFRYVVVTVKSHQLDDNVPAIRLDAAVSKRILEYPKSNEQVDVEAARIIIFAELRRHRYPIVNATVFGHIQGLNEKTITFRLYDDGAFPDKLANDGVYTAAITRLEQPQRYSVSVTVSNANLTAKLVNRETDYFERERVDCDRIDCVALFDFEREAYAGSIKLTSTDNEERLPPNPITDLRATLLNETERLIALEWTSPDDKVFDMHVNQYDIRAIMDDEFDKFDSAFRFDYSHFVAGSFDENSHADHRVEKILLRIPDPLWKYENKKFEPGFFLELTFAVKGIGMNDMASPKSNLAFVVVKDKPLVHISVHSVCEPMRRYIYDVGWISIIYC